MQDQLDDRERGDFHRHALQRPQRDGDAEREQRRRCRRRLQEFQQPVERDRRVELQRRRQHAERGRH